MKHASLTCACLLAAVGVALHLGCIGGSQHVCDHDHAWVADRGDRNVKSGVTTQEAALGLLGRPDVTMADGRLLAYTWTTSSGNYVPEWMSKTCFDPGIAPSVNETHYLLLEFDATGMLLHKQLHHGGTINIYAHGINDAIQ
jgi:hypothetical protein